MRGYRREGKEKGGSKIGWKKTWMERDSAVSKKTGTGKDEVVGS